MKKVVEDNFLDIFHSEDACKEYIKKLVYGGGMPNCPYCNNSENIYIIENGKRYKCSACKKKYSIITSSLFSDMKISLQKEFYILWNYISKNSSSYEVERVTNTAQKNTYSHKVRLHNIMKTISIDENLDYMGIFESVIIKAFTSKKVK